MVPPGDPAACPADVCAPPPMDGACADMGGAMMPPEGGYDHAPMPADAVMPPPMEMGEGYIDPAMDMADGAPAPGMEGTAADPGAMAPPDPTGELAGSEYIAPASEDGGMGALGDALGGPAAGDPAPAPMDAADAAIGAAMDGAMDQGGAPAPAGPEGAAGSAEAGMPAEDDGPEVDPSAGMG